MKTTVKEKTNTWNKSCKECVKRETELYTMVEAAVMDEKPEQRERGMIRDLLGSFKREGKRKDEARNLIEEMQTQPRRSPEQKLRSGTEAGPCSLGIHRSF